MLRSVTQQSLSCLRLQRANAAAAAAKTSTRSRWRPSTNRAMVAWVDRRGAVVCLSSSSSSADNNKDATAAADDQFDDYHSTTQQKPEPPPAGESSPEPGSLLFQIIQRERKKHQQRQQGQQQQPQDTPVGEEQPSSSSSSSSSSSRPSWRRSQQQRQQALPGPFDLPTNRSRQQQSSATDSTEQQQRQGNFGAAAAAAAAAGAQRPPPSPSSLFSNHRPATSSAASPQQQSSGGGIMMGGGVAGSRLLEAFPLPDPPEESSIEKRLKNRTGADNAFPDENTRDYWEVLEPVLDDTVKFQKKGTRHELSDELAEGVKEWLRLDAPTPLEGGHVIPSLERALKFESKEDKNNNEDDEAAASDNHATTETPQKEAFEQQCSFMDHYGWDRKQFDRAKGTLLQLTNQCAKHGKGLPVPILWQKIQEAGVTDRPTLHRLLYVASTFATSSTRSRALRRSKYAHLTGMASILDVLDQDENDHDDNNKEEEDFVDVTDEIAIYHDLLHPPCEQTINVRVKLLVAKGQAKRAEDLLDAHVDVDTLRLRGYTPVLRLYLELDDVASALRLYRKMRQSTTVHLDFETYIHLFAGLAERGCFRGRDGRAIESAIELGYQHDGGPGLFDELANEMSKEIIEIPEGSAKRLYNALAKGFPSSGLTETDSLVPLQLTDKMAAKDELIASRVRVDTSTGKCPRSGCRLRLIMLGQAEKERLIEGMMILARKQDKRNQEYIREKGPAKPRWKQQEGRLAADDHLMEFYRWLDTRDGAPYTILVDGANVGYYQQNFVDGRFSLHQIKFVVDYLEGLGENPLVVLPNKYTLDWFFVTQGDNTTSATRDRQNQTREEKDIRNELTRRKKIFRVPPGYLDDFYWILASVSPQTASRKNRDLTVGPNDKQGRWPGTRPVLVTNDQMRDHQMAMLEPMCFRRWYSNYIVNYNFAAFANGRCTHNAIGFAPADFFSREIQGNKDESNSTVWHFPIAETEDEYFCVKIPDEGDAKRT